MVSPDQPSLISRHTSRGSPVGGCRYVYVSSPHAPRRSTAAAHNKAKRSRRDRVRVHPVVAVAAEEREIVERVGAAVGAVEDVVGVEALAHVRPAASLAAVARAVSEREEEPEVEHALMMPASSGP